MDEDEELFTKEFLKKAIEQMRKSFKEGHWLPPLTAEQEEKLQQQKQQEDSQKEK